jgi:hypothetical protein
MKDRYAGDPALCAKRVRRSTALVAARSRRRRYFPLPRTAADICVRTVRKGSGLRFQVIAADGPGRTIHCVRLPSTAGNWQSRWSKRHYLWRGQCGRCGRSRPAIFWHTGDTDQCRPLAWISSRQAVPNPRTGHRTSRPPWWPIDTASEPRSRSYVRLGPPAVSNVQGVACKGSQAAPRGYR